MSARESRGEKYSCFESETKSVSDLPGDKVACASISADQPPTLCLVQNHQILGFQTKLAFDLNSIFQNFEIKLKF